MLYFKIDVLSELKKRGFSTYVLRRDRLIGENDIQKLRRGIVPGGIVLDRLCELLNSQPGRLIGYKPAGDQFQTSEKTPEPGPEL